MTSHVILLTQSIREKNYRVAYIFFFLTFKVCPVISRKPSWFYDLSASVFQSLAYKTMA